MIEPLTFWETVGAVMLARAIWAFSDGVIEGIGEVRRMR